MWLAPFCSTVVGVKSQVGSALFAPKFAVKAATRNKLDKNGVSGFLMWTMPRQLLTVLSPGHGYDTVSCYFNIKEPLVLGFFSLKFGLVLVV